MVIGEILSVSGTEGRAGAVTDAPTDPTEPAPTDLLDFPPLPQQKRPAGQRGGGAGGSAGSGPLRMAPEAEAAAQRGGGAGGSAGSGPLRIVPEAEATARLRITLPATMPTPSTALRPQAAWEDARSAAEVSNAAPFARVAASPASPSTLPAQLAAMTTATMVIPLPPSLRPGSGLLTTTLPPNQAAQANAARIGDAFRDTIEEIFGVDFDTVDPADLGLSPRRTASPQPADHPSEYDSGYAAGHDSSADAGYRAEELARQSFPPMPPAPPGPSTPWAEDSPDLAPTVSFPRPVPAEMFGGSYGVPTQRAPLPVAPGRLAPFGRPAGPADPARHALALRYLGGIFHDSSGESSFLDPEEVDQGWIPSAFGAAPPDAPTERIARVPAAAEPVRGRPDSTRLMPRPRPRPVADPAASSAPSAAVPSSRGAAPGPATATSAAATSATSRVAASSAAATSSRGTEGTRTASSTGAGRGRSAARSARSAGHSSHDRAGARRAQTSAADPADGESQSAGRGRGRALTIAGLCVAALAVLYGVALLLSGNVVGGAIPRGTVVAGVPIGGLSPQAARAKLEQALGPASVKPIDLLVGQTPVALDPVKSGLSFDVDATLAQVESQRTNPFTIIPALFGVHHDLAAVTDTDTAALTAALNTVASAYDTPLIEGRITFAHGQPIVTTPRAGRGFDVPTAVNAISTGYLQISGPIVLPVSSLEPLATPAALQAALARLARPAVSAPITLDTGGVVTVLTPTQIGDALTIGPNADGGMVPTFDGNRLRADLNPAALALEQPGSDAAFTLAGGAPQLIPERDGTGFAPQALSAALTGVLTDPAPRRATVHPGALPPAFTTADAQSLGVTSVLGSATLAVPDAPDRVADTQRATSLVMGSVVAPGAVWSFDRTVGPPTLANGFSEIDPSAAKAQGVDLSGGDDLVATAVFDAAFKAGLGDTTHHPNAVYFSRYPAGLDAAVVWPGTDLQWTNTSSHPVYLYASYADGQLTVAVLGQPTYDQVDVTVSARSHLVPAGSDPRPGCPAQPASAGFGVNVTRVLVREGAQVGTEEFHVAYQPFAGTVCAAGSGSGSASSGTQSSAGSGTGTDAGAPTNGGNSGTGSQSPPPTVNPSPAPTNTGGVLGGLLH
jgi:vancomycin resistance protein YoaR